MEALHQHLLRHQHVVDLAARRLRHHRILIVERMPAGIAHEQEWRVRHVGLHVDLVDAAEPVEVVHVGAAEQRAERGREEQQRGHRDGLQLGLEGGQHQPAERLLEQLDLDAALRRVLGIEPVGAELRFLKKGVKDKEGMKELQCAQAGGGEGVRTEIQSRPTQMNPRLRCGRDTPLGCSTSSEFE